MSNWKTIGAFYILAATSSVSAVFLRAVSLASPSESISHASSHPPLSSSSTPPTSTISSSSVPPTPTAPPCGSSSTGYIKTASGEYLDRAPDGVFRTIPDISLGIISTESDFAQFEFSSCDQAPFTITCSNCHGSNNLLGAVSVTVQNGKLEAPTSNGLPSSSDTADSIILAPVPSSNGSTTSDPSTFSFQWDLFAPAVELPYLTNIWSIDDSNVITASWPTADGTEAATVASCYNIRVFGLSILEQLCIEAEGSDTATSLTFVPNQTRVVE